MEGANCHIERTHSHAYAIKLSGNAYPRKQSKQALQRLTLLNRRAKKTRHMKQVRVLFCRVYRYEVRLLLP